ncbi:MAG TPA: hypothetical protein QGH10_21365, partial [Armatimonadota bacterium]|nr:hypothetical protein [Armatimonadota bacterium]
VANVGVTPEKVDVRYLNAAGPLGLVAARGEYDFDGPIEAEVALAEVPVKQIYSLVQEMSPDLEDDPDGTPETAAEEKAPPEFGGTAYVYGFVEGELKNPHVTADLAVLEPGYNEWSAAAVTASLDATPADVRVDDVLIRRGSVVVSADATVTDIAWPPGSFFSEEDPLPEGTEAPPIDAKLYAKIRAAGFELTQIAEFIEIPETVRFMGLAELNVEAAGTVREPNATGTLIVSDARVAAVEQNVAAGPMTINASFEADTDTVILRELATDLGDGHIAVNGELTGISSEDDPYITAAFEVAGIPIDQYTPTEGVPSAVGGTIETFTGTVEGPLADPWPTVEAQLVVRELGLGRRTLGDVTFGTTYRDGAVAFSNIGLDIAGGRLDATSATYDPAERGLDVQIAAKQLDVRELLFWGGDLALQAGGENAEASRDRLYGLAHRVEGSISADAIVLEGTLDSVQGRLDALRTHGVSFDQQDIPDVGIACQFSGLHLAAPPSEEINGPDVVSIPMLPEGEEEPSTIDRLHVDGLSISSEIEGGVLTVQGDIHWDGDMDLLAEVNLIPLDYFSPWLPESLDLGGELALTVLAQGATHDPFIQASVEVFDPTVAGVVFDILQATRIEVKPDAIVMIGALLKRDEHEIEASGSLPFDRDSFAIDWDGPVAFQANMVDLPSTVLVDLGHEFSASTSGQDSEGSFWQKCETEGSITASLNVSGKLDAPEVRGGLYVEPGARFRLANWPEDMAIEDISVDAVFGKSPTDEGAMIEALDIRSRIDNTDIAMWGRIELSHLSPDELLENRIEEFTIKAQSDRQRMPGGTVAKNLNAEITAHTDPTGWHAVRVEEGRADLGKGKIRVGGTVLLDTLPLDELGHVPCNLTINLNRANLEF